MKQTINIYFSNIFETKFVYPALFKSSAKILLKSNKFSNLSIAEKKKFKILTLNFSREIASKKA